MRLLVSAHESSNTITTNGCVGSFLKITNIRIVTILTLEILLEDVFRIDLFSYDVCMCYFIYKKT